MVIVDMAAAFLMGALSGMGIGGGGLLVIYLTFLKGTDQITAQGLNLYFFLFASVAAMFVHSKKRRIDYSQVLLFGLFGMPAALFGSWVASQTDPLLVKRVFGGMLLAAGGLSLMKNIPLLIKKKKK